MKRNGRRFRCVLRLVLCAAMLLPLFGCGKEKTVEPSSESAVTEAAQTEIDPVEAALAAARADVEQRQYDSAAEILEQAMEYSADSRLPDLLEQVEEQATVPLDVAVSQDATTAMCACVWTIRLRPTVRPI